MAKKNALDRTLALRLRQGFDVGARSDASTRDQGSRQDQSAVSSVSGMKWLGLSIVLLASPVVGQEHLFLDFDSIANCDILKDGTFLNIDQSKSTYYMVVKDGIQTEYVQDGKYYVKSRMDWLSACSYRSVVIEVTIPGYTVKPGESATTEILQTLCGEYVKFRAQMGKNEMISVYHKMDTPPCP